MSKCGSSQHEPIVYKSDTEEGHDSRREERREGDGRFKSGRSYRSGHRWMNKRPPLRRQSYHQGRYGATHNGPRGWSRGKNGRCIRRPYRSLRVHKFADRGGLYTRPPRYPQGMDGSRNLKSNDLRWRIYDHRSPAGDDWLMPELSGRRGSHDRDNLSHVEAHRTEYPDGYEARSKRYDRGDGFNFHTRESLDRDVGFNSNRQGSYDNQINNNEKDELHGLDMYHGEHCRKYDRSSGYGVECYGRLLEDKKNISSGITIYDDVDKHDDGYPDYQRYWDCVISDKERRSEKKLPSQMQVLPCGSRDDDQHIKCKFYGENRRYNSIDRIKNSPGPWTRDDAPHQTYFSPNGRKRFRSDSVSKLSPPSRYSSPQQCSSSSLNGDLDVSTSLNEPSNSFPIDKNKINNSACKASSSSDDTDSESNSSKSNCTSSDSSSSSDTTSSSSSSSSDNTSSNSSTSTDNSKGSIGEATSTKSFVNPTEKDIYCTEAINTNNKRSSDDIAITDTTADSNPFLHQPDSIILSNDSNILSASSNLFTGDNLATSTPLKSSMSCNLSSASSISGTASNLLSSASIRCTTTSSLSSSTNSVSCELSNSAVSILTPSSFSTLTSTISTSASSSALSTSASSSMSSSLYSSVDSGNAYVPELSPQRSNPVAFALDQLARLTRWVLKSSVQRYMPSVRPPQLTGMQLGIQRDGYINKWAECGVMHVVMVEKNVRCAELAKRVHRTAWQQGIRYSVDWVCRDYTREVWRHTLVDVACGHLALHSSFETAPQAELLAHNIACSLKEGSCLITTVFSPTRVLGLVRASKDGRSFVGPNYKLNISRSARATLPQFGVKLSLQIGGGKFEEYLVLMSVLEDIFQSHGLQLLTRKSFLQLFDEACKYSTCLQELQQLQLLAADSTGDRDQLSVIMQDMAHLFDVLVFRKKSQGV